MIYDVFLYIHNHLYSLCYQNNALFILRGADFIYCRFSVGIDENIIKGNSPFYISLGYNHFVIQIEI